MRVAKVLLPSITQAEEKHAASCDYQNVRRKPPHDFPCERIGRIVVSDGRHSHGRVADRGDGVHAAHPVLLSLSAQMIVTEPDRATDDRINET